MAQGKKSFIAYSDWKDTFDQLPDEDAGKLIKHIFAYVNDENPTSDSILINAVFANIKSSLKRDLEKWDKQLIQRSEAGKRSAQARATKFNERSTSVNERQRNSTDSVSVSVSVNDSVSVNENNINRREEKFKTEVLTYRTKYDAGLLNDFYIYWSEPNKSKTKMKFELERTFDINRRLTRWASNNFNNKKNGTYQQINNQELASKEKLDRDMQEFARACLDSDD